MAEKFQSFWYLGVHVSKDVFGPTVDQWWLLKVFRGSTSSGTWTSRTPTTAAGQVCHHVLRHSTEGALVPHKNSPEDHWHPTMQWDAPHLVQLHERSTPPWMQTLYLCHLHSATEPCMLVWPHWAATFTPQLSHYWAQNIHFPANWTAFSISAHTRSSCYTLVQHRSASTPPIPSP